jgi:hypothetical protein
MMETSTRSARGSGSIRERASGVLAIRIVVGFDGDLVADVGTGRLLYAGQLRR